MHGAGVILPMSFQFCLFMRFSDFFVFDGSFYGMLSAVFEALWRGQLPPGVYRGETRPNNMFAYGGVEVVTDYRKAGRVWRRLRGRLSEPMLEMILSAFRCGSEVVDNSLLRFMFKVIVSPGDVSNDFSDKDLADLLRYSRMARSA